MIPELGHFALIVSLLVSILLGVLPLAGIQTGRLAWVALARPAAQVQFLLVTHALEVLRAARVAGRLALPGRLTHTARRWTLHLPARWPWQNDYEDALARIRTLPAPG